VAGTVSNYSNVNPSDKNQLIVYAAFTIGSLLIARLRLSFLMMVQPIIRKHSVQFLELQAPKVREFTSLLPSEITALRFLFKDNYVKISAIGTGHCYKLTSSTRCRSWCCVNNFMSFKTIVSQKEILLMK